MTEQEPKSLLGRITAMVQSDQFELFVAFLVASNFFTMAAEIQYDGLQLGYELGHRFMTMPASEFWPGAEEVFQFFRTAFLIAFTTEILLRMIFLRAKFCKTAFNIIDFVALLASIIELFSLNLPVDPTLLRLCRLAKLFRTIRVLRVSGMLDSLSMLARCMSSSGLTLIWSLLFLLVIQLIAAMMVCLMVRPYLNDISNDEGERYAVYRYYGTFSVAVLTLFEVFFANWSPACRILTDNVTEWYSLLFLIYRCAIGFAVINVVNAVFVQQTLQVAKGDEEVLFLEKQKAEEKYFKNVAKIFTKLDTSGDGLLSWGEFEQLLEDPKLRFLLDKLEIAAGDLKVLFDLLDDTGDGEISVEEFIEGVTRFKGAAKSLDVGQVLLRARRMERHIVNVEKLLLHPNDDELKQLVAKASKVRQSTCSH
ncbi:Sodium channel protein type 4 subunit alpha B (Voltage-gated sodium channel subunit alpha Nav1.4b) [Durusdinium trenchii]|uniref:Sodium channel protein type 4 subunit alpha B (Voltage-gated sodium channel subunit alpha Nav1.4b) n=1 Tax=Durusdinium trenchii TaxID=1381693 RepID=A0ABP0PGR0_9DINO